MSTNRFCRASDHRIQASKPSMVTMAYRVIDRLFLVAFGVAPPSDAAWSDYMAAVERHGIDRTMQLITTEGGVPTPPQRRDLLDRLAGRYVPVAVLSGSPTIRGVVTAMSWFNQRLRAFPPTGLREAIAYLEIPASRTELIARALEKLRLEVSWTGRKSA